jgi:putative copper resistance protein D
MTDPLVAARAVHFVSTTMVAGALCFAFFVFDPALNKVGGSAPAGPPLRRLLAWIVWSGLAVAIASGAAWLILFSTRVGGHSLSETVASEVIGTVLTQTQFGRTWQLRGVLSALLMIVLVAERRGAPSVTAGGIKVAVAAVLIGALVWAGHGGADEGIGGDIHLIADIMHLLAAAMWVGALIPLAFLFATAWRSRNAMDAAVTLVATRRFSTLGIISVGTLLATGIVNTWFLAGSIPALVGTDYGRLLLVKIALFLTMVCIAVVNRTNLTPRLALGPTSEAARVPLGQLARNSVVEAGLGLLILLIVGVLGIVPPAGHQQPSWPFALRLDASVLNGPIDRAAIAFAAIGVVGGIALIIAGVPFQRWRWRMVVAGLSITIASLAGLERSTVRAFPTSYYRSPTGYAAASIGLGRTLFDQHCAACHGAEGRGGFIHHHEGAVSAADLTADHIYAHADGDLFWWITHGIDEKMPGFGSVIDDNGRWNLIDFVHANADAVRLRANIRGSAYPMPDFAADCTDGTSVTTADLRGRLVHLIIAGANAMERLQQLAHAHIAHDLVTVVVAPEGSSPPDAPFCVVQDDRVLAGFAVYHGDAPSDSEGTELLIDATGQLRALWYPGLEPEWTDVDVLRREIAAIRDPAETARTVSHAHVH